MSESAETLRRKLDSAIKLGGVVRVMKALAASNLGQCERAVEALGEYRATVELGLRAGLRELGGAPGGAARQSRPDAPAAGAVVFGSDQGLVGRFNETLRDALGEAFREAGAKPVVWAVGERVRDALAEADLAPAAVHAAPVGVPGIVPLVAALLGEIEHARSTRAVREVHLFFQQPGPGSTCAVTRQRLLPLDRRWRDEIAERPWPTRSVPQVIGSSAATLRALVGEYLFVSLYAACAYSLAAENLTRLAAMQRAEQNIEDLQDTLNQAFNRERQTSIDEELFDVAAGFEVLVNPTRR